MALRHFYFGSVERHFLEAADLYKPLLFIFGRSRLIFRISGTFLEQVVQLDTLEHMLHFEKGQAQDLCLQIVIDTPAAAGGTYRKDSSIAGKILNPQVIGDRLNRN